MAERSPVTNVVLLVSSIVVVALALSWLVFPGERRTSDASKQQEQLGNMIDGLKKAYKEKLQPLEEMFFFEGFYSFMIIDSEFEVKPMILLLGQNSTGKTSFIQYFLGSDFEGMEIGPKPTTDSFMAVMYGEQKQVTPGDVLVRDKTQHFRGLSEFGSKFLRHFKASSLPNPVLKSITLIDTPVILSGEKHLTDHEYDFASISGWFAEQADMIVLFFDVHNVDICESVINLIKRHHKKVIVVLNKADTISTLELIRVYGRLMWNLLTIRTSEPLQVYLGSFWGKEYHYNESHDLFDRHRDKLCMKIQTLSWLNDMNKVTRMIQRAHHVRTHVHILCHLRKEMSLSFWGQEAKQKELIDNLERELEIIQAKSECQHEFPDVKKMKEQLRKYDFMKFPNCNQAKDKFSALDSMFSDDLAEVSQLLTKKGTNKENRVKCGAFNVKQVEL